MKHSETSESKGGNSSLAENARRTQRSPKYPGITLESAIQRARTFHDCEKRNAANISVALKHWNLAANSSTAHVTIAAMLAYGLMVDTGSGKERKLRLSESALRMILDKRQPSPERELATKEAALKPQMHQNVWRRWGPDLPSHENLRHALIFDWKFNENSADTFIRQYKATIAFAKITSSDELALAPAQDDPTEEQRRVPDAGDYVRWESQGVHQFPVPRRIRSLSENGEFAFVDGSDTGLPVAQLVRAEAPPQTTETTTPKTTPGKQRPGMRQDVFSVAEGDAIFRWPEVLCAESIEDLKDWMDLMKRKIGRVQDSAFREPQKQFGAVLSHAPKDPA
jgi:hypothetical protein